MNKKKLDEILKKHSDWFYNVSGGIRANLSWANLIGANLSESDLREANLIGANLSESDLRGSDLSWADLSGADLRGSDLSGANLRGSNLSGAKTDKQYLIVSCIGSRKDSTTYCVDDDKIWCGCFSGNLAEFEKRVHETYPDGQYRNEYDAAIAFFRAVAGIKGER